MFELSQAKKQFQFLESTISKIIKRDGLQISKQRGRSSDGTIRVRIKNSNCTFTSGHIAGPSIISGTTADLTVGVTSYLGSATGFSHPFINNQNPKVLEINMVGFIVTLTGNNLDVVDTIVYLLLDFTVNPYITVTNINHVDNNTLILTLDITIDCPILVDAPLQITY